VDLTAGLDKGNDIMKCFIISSLKYIYYSDQIKKKEVSGTCGRLE